MSHEPECDRFANDHSFDSTRCICLYVRGSFARGRVAALDEATKAIEGMLLVEPDERWDGIVRVCRDAVRGLLPRVNQTAAGMGNPS